MVIIKKAMSCQRKTTEHYFYEFIDLQDKTFNEISEIILLEKPIKKFTNYDLKFIDNYITHFKERYPGRIVRIIEKDYPYLIDYMRINPKQKIFFSILSKSYVFFNIDSEYFTRFADMILSGHIHIDDCASLLINHINYDFREYPGINIETFFKNTKRNRQFIVESQFPQIIYDLLSNALLNNNLKDAYFLYNSNVVRIIDLVMQHIVEPYWINSIFTEKMDIIFLAKVCIKFGKRCGFLRTKFKSEGIYQKFLMFIDQKNHTIEEYDIVLKALEVFNNIINFV